MRLHAAGSPRIEKKHSTERGEERRWRWWRRREGGGESVHKPTEKKRGEGESDAERKYRHGVLS